jgi:hypothetical protein
MYEKTYAPKKLPWIPVLQKPRKAFSYEHFGNYVPSVMSEFYDAFIFIDQTNALPLVNEKVVM